MRGVRDFLWSATAVVTLLGAVLATGRLGRGEELFNPMPYTGGLLLKLAAFGLAPLALVATVLAWPWLQVKLGIAQPKQPKRKDAPKHAPPPDGPAA